jgi:RNA methyltransferase, TrmH family
MQSKSPSASLSTFPALSIAQQQQLRRLHKKSERERERLCVLEGEHLCEELLRAITQAPGTVHIRAIVVDASTDEVSVQQLSQQLYGLGYSVFTATPQKFAALTDAATPQGILAVIDFPERPFVQDAPVLVLDSVADPGNVGTIIRTAAWFGIPNVLLGEGCADRFHPKTLRATMGAVFRCAVHSSQNLASTLRQDFASYRLYGASLQGAVALEEIDFSGNIGIVMGSEAHGISPEVLSTLAGTFSIQGFGAVESLNVAVAAGVVLYHVAHHR